MPGQRCSSRRFIVAHLRGQRDYYQAFLKEGAYFEPALTYVPNPGERTDIRDAWALTMRIILLF